MLEMVPVHSVQRVYPEMWKAPNRVDPMLCSCSCSCELMWFVGLHVACAEQS